MAFHSPSPPPTDCLNFHPSWLAASTAGDKTHAAMIVGLIFVPNIFFFVFIYTKSFVVLVFPPIYILFYCGFLFDIFHCGRRRFPLIPVDDLPVFEYKAQSFKDVLECAICLSEFQENEKGRFLPNCEHSFHVDCIDMWFHSHSTCPVCRTDVEPKQRVSNGNNDEISINVELVSSGNREFGISPGLAQGETSSHETETAEQITIHERNVLDAGNRH